MNTTTTVRYTQKQLTDIKRRGAVWMAKDVMTDINWASGKYIKLLHAKYFAAIDVNAMTTRQIYAYLKAKGFTFDAPRAAWKHESEATS